MNRFPSSSSTSSATSKQFTGDFNASPTRGASTAAANCCVSRYTHRQLPTADDDDEDETATGTAAVDAEAAENGGAGGLPERGLIKNLLAQWREIEQQRQSVVVVPRSTSADEDATSPSSACPTARGSRSTTKDDHRSKYAAPSERANAGGYSVRDEVTRLRSQSCDPVASPSRRAGGKPSYRQRLFSDEDQDDDDDDDGCGRGRRGAPMDGDGGMIREEEFYKSQPSLTKAILAKFETLDAEAHSGAETVQTTKRVGCSSRVVLDSLGGCVAFARWQHAVSFCLR